MPRGNHGDLGGQMNVVILALSEGIIMRKGIKMTQERRRR
jgi:hypothetical protein